MVKQPTQEQLWACLARCLLFDEPAIKWTKLLAQVAKLIKNGPTDIADEPLPAQQQMFCDVFGGNEDKLPPRIFNIVLALEDIDRFEDSCFFNWYLSSVAEANSSVRSVPLCDGLVKQLGLSKGAAIWLEHAYWTVPDWSAALSEGPWNDDSLAGFVADCLNPHLSAEESCETVLAMRETFRSLLKRGRKALPSSFQPELILLVEGVTEAILIPRFAKLLSADLDALVIIACGGANQLLRKYIALVDITPLPICCLIDKDADEQIAMVQQIHRPDKDAIHVWREGEIEDALGIDILLRYLNLFLSENGASSPVSLGEMASRGSHSVDLDRLWRARGLGDFDKVGFARYVADHIVAEEIPQQVRQLIGTLKGLAGVRNHDRR